MIFLRQGLQGADSLPWPYPPTDSTFGCGMLHFRFTVRSNLPIERIREKVARCSPASVLVVKQYAGHVRSMFKRAFG